MSMYIRIVDKNGKTLVGYKDSSGWKYNGSTKVRYIKLSNLYTKEKVESKCNYLNYSKEKNRISSICTSC